MPSAAAAPGADEGSAVNTGSTALQAPRLELFDFCPSYAASATRLAQNDPRFYCARTTYDVLERGTYWWGGVLSCSLFLLYILCSLLALSSRSLSFGSLF